MRIKVSDLKSLVEMFNGEFLSLENLNDDAIIIFDKSVEAEVWKTIEITINAKNINGFYLLDFDDIVENKIYVQNSKCEKIDSVLLKDGTIYIDDDCGLQETYYITYKTRAVADRVTLREGDWRNITDEEYFKHAPDRKESNKKIL